MSDITLSSAVRSNLLSLQNTADLLAQTQERLATGKEVNSALDNPTNFFTASALNSRANDLSRLLDGVSNATQTLEAADNGISAITNLVESAQATARQAQQTSATIDQVTGATAGTLAGTGFSAINLTGGSSPPSGADLAGTGTFANLDLSGSTDADSIDFDLTLDGTTQSISISGADATSAGFTSSAITQAQFVTLLNNEINTAFSTVGETYAFADGSAIDIRSTTTGASSNVTVASFNADGTGTSTIANGTNSGSAAVAATDSISFTLDIDGDGPETITIDDAALNQYDAGPSSIADRTAITATELAAVINQEIGDAGFTSGITATASVVGGQISIASGTTGTSSSIAIASFAETAASGGSGLANGTNSGAAESTTQITNPARSEFISQYNEIIGQIDELAEDASFNGVNLLNGDDLEVVFNEDGSSELEITGVTYDAAGLGLSTLATTAFDTNTSIEGVLTNLDTAIGSLRSQASEFGSNLSIVQTREDFTNNMINTLETGAAELTLADSNEEGANLLALQTRQQLSSTALSLASQADQNVLRLF